MSKENPFVGTWTYRSLLNDPDISIDFNKLQFGIGTLKIDAVSFDTLGGTIGGPGWSLDLHGSFGYGSPMQVRFQGRGMIGVEEWIYDYIGWLVPTWPNSNAQLQRPSIVGSIVRTVPHSGDGGKGPVHPAGVVASWYAVRAK
ncbi:MAG TPA: hypothetical protein VGJ81_19240 [Thermoanaerobaculia bacterium]